MTGTVIDVRVFTRDGVERDARALAIQEESLKQVRKDLLDELRIYETDVYERVGRLVLNQVADGDLIVCAQVIPLLKSIWMA